MDVGSARVEITGDVSRFAGEVARELNSILAGMRLRPVEVDGDFKRAEDSASDAADSIERDFQAGAERSEDALAGVDEDFREPRDNASQAAESIASDFESASSRASAALGSATKFMLGAIAGVAAAATAAATAIAAVSLTRGFSRLADIEDAEAKLRGLGHTGDSVRLIMDNAMEAVEGTILGFNDMAGVAASIVGAGVEPGRELERTLKAIADAAQIGGVDLAEMGDIIGQVAVAGRASMTEINRMQTRGIPILSWLAEQMGVTAEEARDMVSAGEVSFRDFRKAIEDNIGGAALEAAETTRGAWTNMVFTFTRTGAALLSGVFPTFKEVFNGIAEAMAPVEELANQIGPALGAALEAFRGGGGLRGAIDAFRESLDPEVFNSATGAIRDMVTNGLAFLRDNAVDIVGTLLEMRGAVFDALLGVIENIAQALPQLIPQVVDAIVSMVTGIVNTLVNAAPAVLQGAISLVTGLVDGLLASLPLVIDGAVSIIETILTVLVQALPDLITAGIDLLVGIVTGIISALPQLQAAILGLVPVIILAVIQILPQLATLGIQLLLALIEGFVQAIPDMMETVRTEVIPAFMEAVRTEFPAALAQGVEFLQQFVTGIAESIEEIARVVTEEVVPAFTELLEDNPEIIDAGIQVIMTLIQAWVDNIEMITAFITETMIPLMTTVIEENLPEIVDAGILILEAVVDGLIEASPEIKDAIIDQIIPAMFQALITAIPAMNRAGTQLIGALISSLWSTWSSRSKANFDRIKNAITNFFSNAGQWLRDAGSRIISGLINGIRDRFDDVRNTLGNLTSMLPSWKGPAELDRRILRDAGRQVMEGFQAGIQDERGNIERLLRGITTDIGSIGAFTGRVQGGDGAAAGAVNVTIAPGAVVIQGQGREAGEQAAEAILERLAQSVLVR